MTILDEAIILATRAHSGSFRKGTKIPYIVHPMEAAAIAASMTDDEEIIAAAVLHDVVEDTEYTSKDIREKFGERIEKLVAADSEDKRETQPSTDTWKVRKMEKIDFIKNQASREDKIVILSDKLSNIRAIYRDYLVLGDQVWERFNQKDKNEHGWYYRSFVELLSELKEFPAWQEYKELVSKVFGE